MDVCCPHFCRYKHSGSKGKKDKENPSDANAEKPSHALRRKPKRTLQECVEICQQYATLSELCKHNNKIYAYVKLHGFEEACFAHFDTPENQGYGDGIRYGGRRKQQSVDYPSVIDGPYQRLTYKYRIPHTDELDHYMRVANNLYNQCAWEFRHALDDKDDPHWLSHFTLRDRMRTILNKEGKCNFKLMPSEQMADNVVLDFSVSCRAFATQMRNHKPGEGIPHPPAYRKRGAMYQLRVRSKSRNHYIFSDGTLRLTSNLSVPIYGFEDYRERLRNFVSATLIPHPRYIEVAIYYDVPLTPDPELDEASYAAIDLGLDNFVSMVDQYQTTIYHGGFLKSRNQLYFDTMRQLKRAAQWKKGDPYTHRMQRLHDKHQSFIDDVTNKVSRHITDYLQSRHIGVLIIGWDYHIKQRIKLDRNTAHLFLYAAHGKLIDKLQYKCHQVGIQLVLTEERHTSKCDALALEPICHHDEYLGRRVKRGLFRSSTGRVINADVNGAINIMRKVIGDCAFVKDIISSGHLFCPVGYKHPFGWAANK